MLFDVASFLRRAAGATEAYRLSERQDASDEMPAADVTGTVSFLRTQGGILVSACLSAVSTDACSRCLEPSTIDERYRFPGGVRADRRYRYRRPPVATRRRFHHRRATGAGPERGDPAVSTGVTSDEAAVPARLPEPLSDCGANLNLGPCACPMKAPTPAGRD